MHYSAKCGLAIACHLSVCPSVTLVDHDHIGWNWKLIVRSISPRSSLFVAQRSSTYAQRNMEKFWGENVCSTLTSITSGWIESTESHVILGVAVRLLLSAHRAVIFAIAQLSCSPFSGVFRRICAWNNKSKQTGVGNVCYLCESVYVTEFFSAGCDVRTVYRSDEIKPGFI